MIDSLKRWWSRVGSGAADADFDVVEAWAERCGFRYRKATDGQRFVVEATSGGQVLRMEWGPSQRSYIAPDELRIRMDLNLPGSLQLLAMTRPLMEQLESETFERYTQDAQTVIDMSTPEEMRWLAMFPKLDLASRPLLRAHYGVLGVDPAWAQAWIDGPLGVQLERAAQQLLAAQGAFVLLTLRGKVYLRMQLAEPRPETLSQCLEVFDAAAQSALQVIGQIPPEMGWASTASTSWQTQTPIDG